MTERYFKKMYEEEYYIFDSETISESEFDERFEYSGYRAFEDSMQGDEVIDQLNKQEEIIECLKTCVDAKQTLINVCEKKLKELGYIITVDDDGYVIE